MKLRYALCLLMPWSVAHGEPRYTQHDFGGVGLLQTPTARMAPAGEVSINANRTDPYSRYSFSLQPFDWLETSFRYTSVSNRRYGPESLSGDQSYKDKAVDAKLRLLKESHWLPEVAVGARDVGGTGLFSSEYFVGNKRFGDFDMSLGIAWGYIGNRGDFDNPLGWIDDKYDERPAAEGTGDVNTNGWFRGSPALFGGVLWQTPWDRLSVKLEYEGNNYENEPQDNNQKQDSPVNLGFVFKAGDSVDLHAAWERGNTAMFGITLHTNFATRSAPPKTYDPPAEKLPASAPNVNADQVDWAGVSQRLRNNAGYKVERIARKDSEIIVYGEQTRYLYPPKAVGRTARILDNSVSDDIQWFTVVDKRYDMPVAETSLPRKTFREVVQHDRPLADLRRATEQNWPLPHQEEVLFEQKPDPFTYGLGLGYKQNVGGPDGFLLYQFTADLSAEYRFTPDTWWSGMLSGNLLNNFDKFKYDAPSGLPRVRTDIRQYVTTSDVTMPSFQLNKVKRLDEDLYGMVYGGYLESMYAGVGGEMLYRPLNERWALGADLNFVRQRDFDQGFGLRDYDVITGNITGYLKTDFQDVLAAVSVGRYLARDWGTTIDLSREFSNGVRFGGWVTLTTASKEEYGEGSFDKGIYISIPFDELMSSSTMRRANLAWAPLTRDGGARLGRSYSLYTLTDGRNVDMFDGSFSKIVE
ncbi:YjbH domain-containing protein [Pseudomonas schmalbachii]|uniref:YjbH domain-containing protein n=1 Tax=Pseudomonas schmalbachii TaxID=2816993 RepID=A0ABS3TU17_9PSED|nr:YjbH domain-containing protein [Pseudomonas schmalbachii]MBO3277166.1 YjbH domain-containing protein [Pseudomonas schmalbachii]